MSSVSKFVSQVGFGLGFAAIIGLVCLEVVAPTVADSLFAKITGATPLDSTTIESWKRKYADERRLRNQAEADTSALQLELGKKQTEMQKASENTAARLKAKDDEIASLKRAAQKMKIANEKAKKESTPLPSSKPMPRNPDFW